MYCVFGPSDVKDSVILAYCVFGQSVVQDSVILGLHIVYLDRVWLRTV